MKNKGKAPAVANPVQRFIRVCLPNSCENHMDLPIAFNRLLANPLPRKVTIRSPTGIWTVALRRIDGKVAFAKGWEKFYKDNKLKWGEFLMFKYDGSHLFDVTIFGLSACEEIRRSRDVEDIKEEDEDKEGESTDEEEKEEEEEEEEDDDDIKVEEEEEEKEEDDEDGGEDEHEESVDVSQSYLEEMENERLKRKKILNKKESRTPIKKHKKGGGGGRGGSSSKGKGKLRQYLDSPMNPFFTPDLMNKRIDFLHIPASLIKDYGLEFPEVMTIIDPLGKLKRKVSEYRDRCFNVMGFKSIYKRNWVESKDTVICELLRENDGRVYTIKVHIIRG